MHSITRICKLPIISLLLLATLSKAEATNCIDIILDKDGRIIFLDREEYIHDIHALERCEYYVEGVFLGDLVYEELSSIGFDNYYAVDQKRTTDIFEYTILSGDLYPDIDILGVKVKSITVPENFSDDIKVNLRFVKAFSASASEWLTELNIDHSVEFSYFNLVDGTGKVEKVYYK